MRIPTLICGLAAIAAWTASGAAWEVGNKVVIEHGELVIDHSKSVADITRAQAKGGFPGGHGLGLFQNRLKAELRVESTQPGTRRLAMTTTVRTSPVIYVAREFPKDSCAYGVVLGHELLHQMYDRDVLRLVPDEVRRITQDVFLPETLENEGARGLERARSRFLGQFKYVYEGLSGERHAVIDSPESYRWLGTLCGGEIARTLAGAKL